MNIPRITNYRIKETKAKKNFCKYKFSLLSRIQKTETKHLFLWDVSKNDQVFINFLLIILCNFRACFYLII